MKQDNLSPEAYLKKGNARKLPIYKCWVTADYAKHGIANVIVSRKHKNGNISAGFYLVDLYCLGIKDSLFFFNLFESEFNESVVFRHNDMEEVSYEFAHNLIYGAETYAHENGLAAHKSFKETQLVLEEDTDAIELIYFEFGFEGKPHLVINPVENRNKELRILEQKFGKDGFTFIKLIDDEDYYENDDDDDDFEDDDENDFENEEVLQKLNLLNDSDQIYYFEYEDIDLIDELAILSETSDLTQSKKLMEVLMKCSETSETAFHMSMDGMYLSMFPDFREQVDATRFISASQINKAETIFEYLTDHQIIDDNFDSLMSQTDSLDEALLILTERFKINEDIYTYLEECYEGDFEKLEQNSWAFYNHFPNLLFAQAKLLSLLYLSNDENEDSVEILKSLPFKIEASLNFHESNPIGKEYHVAELSSFLFLNGFAFAANNQVIETEKCLLELAKFRSKDHEFFAALRMALTQLKEKIISENIKGNNV